MTNAKTCMLALSIAAGIALSACGDYYEEIEVTRHGDTLDIVGGIDAQTIETLRAAIEASPDLKRLRLVHIPGSSDDEASLTVLASLIREKDLEILVPSEGMVASGGTDMAVMSQNRIIENGACIGVHSWGAGGVFGGISGADLPRDDPEHQLYLDFYQSVDVPEEFYWFTLEVASPEEIHWMSPAEINRFNLSNLPLRETGAESASERAARCDLR